MLSSVEADVQAGLAPSDVEGSDSVETSVTTYQNTWRQFTEVFRPESHYKVMRSKPAPPNYQQRRPIICPVQSSPSSLSAGPTVHLSCSVQSVLIISSTDRSSVLFSPARPHYQQYLPFICPVQSSPSSLSAGPTVHLSCSVQSVLIVRSTDHSSVLFSPVRPHCQMYRPFICPFQSSPSSLLVVQTIHLSCSVQSVLIVRSTDHSSVLFSPVRLHYQQYRPFMCPVQSSPSSSAVQTVHLSCSVQHRQIISSTAKLTHHV